MEIREYLKREPLLFDGAMGTYYAERTEHPLESCEMANLLDPDTVLDIHRAYIAAGCRAIKTNTFAANEEVLDTREMVEKAVAKGYELACRAAEGRGVFVFADMGPIPGESEDMEAAYRRILDVFLSLGAKHFLFETFSSGACLHEAAAYLKSKRPDCFVLTDFSVSPEGYTREGISGERLFHEFSRDENIDALGFNCVSGPHHLLRFLRTLDTAGKTVSIMPNAGYPTVVNNRTFFGKNAVYFAEQILEIVRQGARIVGGCCGTTPEFIAKTAEKLRGAALSPAGAQAASPSPEEKQPATPLSPAGGRLLDKLARGEKLIAVEWDPPEDADIEPFVSGAHKLQDAGADAVTIADCPVARARADSSLLACKLRRELDIEPLPHMTCRDRNINATKALLLGLSMEDVSNVLVVTGDPIPTAERDEIKSVYNFNSAMLAGYIRDLNEKGVFRRPFDVFGALNINAPRFDLELNRARRKIEHGMSMFLTQPILSKAALENLKHAREALDAKILGGILPIVSYRNARFMNSEVSGIVVSEGIMALYQDVSKERAAQLAVETSVSIARAAADFVDGYYLITPFRRVEISCAVIRAIRENAPPPIPTILDLPPTF